MAVGAEPQPDDLPGQTARVTVRMNAEDEPIGRYEASLWFKEDTPYLVRPVDVTMRVRR